MSSKNRAWRGGPSILAFLGASLLSPSLIGVADAQQTAAPVPEGAIVVTGSHIRGTPENAALPVDVVSQDTLQKQGSPTVVEMIKQLPESSGVIGESNQFVAGGRGQGQYGESTVNLRGLGPERTLVLFNGHRLPLAAGFAVDASMLPLAAIGRVEVLKDGAAATYGSDAIAGVVNFITKKGVTGFDVGGDYRSIDGSDGDYSFNGTWGHTDDRWDIMVAAGYQHRSELPVIGKKWDHKAYDLNPEGGWTGGGNPEGFIPAGLSGGSTIPIAGSRLDLGCTAQGGQLTTAKPANLPPLLPWGSCRGQYSIWDALEEQTNSYQVYSEFNASLGGSHKFHLEAEYAYTDIPFFKSSPSYVTTRPVPATVLPASIPQVAGTGFVAGSVPPSSFFYFVPASNPGFAAYTAANPGQFPGTSTGAFIQVGTFRPYLTGGNPLYNYAHGVGGDYWHEQINLSASLQGDVFSGIHYDGSLTWGQYKYYGAGRDSLTDRLELALRGLGGPSCNYLTGTPGVGGCMYLNPFSNALPGAPRNGLTNPGFVPAVENTAALADWIMPLQWARGNFQDLEFNFALDGNLPFVLPGGPMGWAAGFQWRRNKFVTSYSQFASHVASPCADSVPPVGLNDCVVATGTGPNVFGPVSNPVNLSQDIFAGFGELTVPITDRLNFDVAGRYEDYGSNGGSTFNPQLRGKWQALDFLAFRGSVGTTFRAPPQGYLIPDPSTSLQQVLGTFIPVSAIGNPTLVPETALTWSAGAIAEAGGLLATIDYWSYDFKKVLTTEPLTQVVNAVFPNGTGAPNNCADPTLAAFIASHFVFAGACGPTTAVAVNLLRINGPEIKTDGVDVAASYRWENVLGGEATLGGTATHVNQYTISALSIGGVPIAGFNAVGKFNSGTIAYPIPAWKAQAYANYGRDGFNIRWTVRFTDAYTDQRSTLFAFNAIYVTPTNPTGIVSAGKVIKTQVLNDLAVRIPLPHDVFLSAAVTNIFDRAPPFARTDLNYDALTGDPLGRAFKVGLQAKF